MAVVATAEPHNQADVSTEAALDQVAATAQVEAEESHEADLVVASEAEAAAVKPRP